MIAFTILYNSINHLNHNDFTSFMLEEFDHWIVIEGLSLNGGSTSWCKALDLPGRSDDGTHEMLKDLNKKHSNLHYYSKGKPWESKDEMVNKATEILRGLADECILWQVDADEQWSKKNLYLTTKAFLNFRNHTTGRVRFHHIVGKTEKGYLVAQGRWGSGYVNRVWKWKGQNFISHEPAILEGEQKYVNLGGRFNHFSMYFEEDVKFKSKYYQGYERLHENWKRIGEIKPPFRASKLLPKNIGKGTLINEVILPK